MADSNLQELAHQQQMIHLAQAHSQALKLLIDGQQKFKLSVNDALSYLEAVRMKLNPVQYDEFRQTLNQCKNQNWNMGDTLSKICHLFQGHPELIQGFGIFLPPSINLYLQTSGKAFLDTLRHEYNLPVTEVKSIPDMSEVDNEEKTEEVSIEANDTDVNETGIKPDTEVSSNEDEPCENNELFPPKVDNSYANIFLKKVKDTFEHEPYVFERFLQLIESVKRDYPGTKAAIEKEVFAQICDLFQNHDDLIEAFKAFVPNVDCTPISEDAPIFDDDKSDNSNESFKDPDVLYCDPANDLMKCFNTNDPSMAAVYKYGSYEEHLFFDKVRTILDHTEVYDNFLHCLSLYNEDIVTRTEMLQLAASFIGNYPDLLKEFRDILGFKESGDNIEHIPMKIISYENNKLDSETSSDIDYSTGGRNGASYRALPKNHEQPKCSGRTPLCKEVLNDIWVSFPSWSEDSTFVTSCKTQYEETIYRCEDERFELDMAIESNAYTIQVLENVQKRINKMTAEEKSVFALDVTLGGTSTVLHQRALHRIYGDKTDELVEGLKRNPVIAVPIILKRLRAKEEEWREKQNQFNVTWREQIDSFYLKSLDHKGINFKQNDSKCFRSKTLLNEMEIVYMERKEGCGINSYGPHFVQEFKEMCIFEDAFSLICLYLKKLPGIYREDRRRIERMVRGFIHDFYGIPHEALSDEEIEEDEEEEEVEMEEPPVMEVENDQQSGHTSPSESGVFSREDGDSDQDESNSIEENDLSDDMEKNSFVEENENVIDKIDALQETDLPYTLFFVNKNWYIFFRQMFILCDRLTKLLHESAKMNYIPRSENEGNSDTKDFTCDLKSTYQRLIEKLSLLLTGGLDINQFEEEARNLFGIHAYVSFTMDKLILNIVRQLQQIVIEDVCKQCTSYFVQHTRTIAAGGYTSPLEVSHIESEYLKKVEKMMREENCFKVLWHKKELVLTIELLEPDFDVNEDPCEVERQSTYLEEYITENGTSDGILSCKNGLPVCLPRNLRRQIKYWEKKVAITDTLWKERYSETFLNSNPPLFARHKRKLSSSSKSSSSKMARHSPEVEENNDKNFGSENDFCPEEEIDQNSEDSRSSGQKSPEGSERVDELSETASNVAEMEAIGEEIEDYEEVHDDDKVENEDEEEAHDDDKEENEGDKDDSEEIEEYNEENQDEKEENEEEKEENEEEKEREEIEEILPLQEENDADGSVLPGDQISQPENTLECEASPDVKETEEQDKADDIEECNEETEHVTSASELDFESQEGEIEDTDDFDANFASDRRHSDSAASDESDLDTTLQEGGDAEDKSEKPIADDEMDCSSSSVLSIDLANCNESENNFGNSSDDEIRSDMSPILGSDFEQEVESDTGSENSYKSHDDSVSTKDEMGNFSNSQFAQKYRSKADFLQDEKALSEEWDIDIDYEYFSQLSMKEKCYFLAMESLVFRDSTECSFQRSSYKMDYVCNSGTVLYRKDAISNARQFHYQVSEMKTSKFNFWHRIWLERYVTPSMLKACTGWLRCCDTDTFKLVCTKVHSPTKPPYFPYNKYKIRYYKIPHIP